MRRALAAALLASCLSAAAAAQTVVPKPAPEPDPGLAVDPASVALIDRGPAAQPTDILPPSGGGDGSGLILDQIVNIGERVWKIIDENKPVVDVSKQYALAVPAGTTNWAQLSGWKPPRGEVYELVAQNLYHQKVVRIRYQVLRTYGGGLHGKGKYLTAVTAEPLLVDVAWGYKVSVSAEVPDSSIVNAGTDQDPLAAMMVKLSWRIQTPLKDAQGTGVYYVRGDGYFKEVGGPFQTESVLLRRRVARALGQALEYRLP